MKIKSRKRIVAVCFAFAPLLFGGVAADALSAKTPVKERTLWTQSFNEKAGYKINKKFWEFEIGDGYGWGNNEQEYYTNKASNISTNGKGQLVITARKLSENNPGDQYRCFLYLDCLYSSAKIVTRDKLGFKYGSISARMKTPAGTGMWPAFWMLGVPRNTCDGWPACGEIDIMEARGSDNYHSISTLHGTDYSGGGGLSNYFFSGNDALTDGYHTYRVDWLKDSIKFYVDSEYIGGSTKSSIAPKTWAFNAEFYMILNLAVGGQFDGGALDETIQSAELKVDWIRYTTYKGVGTLIKH